VEGVVFDGSQHLPRQRFIVPGRLVAGVDRERPTIAFQDRSLRQPCPEIREVQRGGHQHHRQLRIEQRARFLHQGEGEVRIATAFMELVKQDASNALERGVGLEPSQEEPVGDHLHLGVG